MANGEPMLVYTSSGAGMRKLGPSEFMVDTLADNVAEFLRKMDRLLTVVPSEMKGFVCTEVVVTAEISASGKLVLLGSGLEAEATGGLSFKFEHRAGDDH